MVERLGGGSRFYSKPILSCVAGLESGFYQFSDRLYSYPQVIHIFAGDIVLWLVTVKHDDN